jgi:hypothetical protein
VFEAIIDELIGDNPLPDGMEKKQEDGKIVDHLYTAKSLIEGENKQTYYIGDSKYYKMGHKLGRESIYKQYTYARNVIQWNLDIFNSGKTTPSGVRLRDEVTEGYNIIPNFFISAKMDQAFDYQNDGIDRTDPALVHMIAATGGETDAVGALDAMHIVPLCISYEWEPCGLLKAREVSLKRQGPYTKAPGEDTQSILSGISDFKGHVHLTFCQPLQMQELEAANGNYDTVAEIIDQRIYQNYHLWPNNYIAHELMTGISHAEHYTDEEKQQFVQYLDKACQQYDIPGYRDTLVGIYGGALH